VWVIHKMASHPKWFTVPPPVPRQPGRRILYPGPGADGLKRTLWESDDKVWVMGLLGDDVMEGVDHLDAIQSRKQEENRKLALSRTSPKTLLRKKTKGAEMPEIPRRYNCSGVGKGGRCSCAFHSPVVMIPLSLASRLDMTIDVPNAGHRLLSAAEGWGVGASPEDFQVDSEERPAFNGGHCHLARFTLKPEKRAAIEEREGLRADTTIERLEHDANVTLLPELLHWCEEYRSIKVQYAVEQFNATREFASYWDNERADLAGMPTQHWIQRPASYAEANAPTPVPNIGRARELCRCGHADVWHQSTPPVSGPRKTTTIDVENEMSADVTRLARSASAPRTLTFTSDGKEPRLVGGRLILKGAGATLIAKHGDSAVSP